MEKLPKTEHELCLFALSDGTIPATICEDKAVWAKFLDSNFPSSLEITSSREDHHLYKFKVTRYRIYVCGHLVDTETGTFSIATDAFYIYNDIFTTRLIERSKRKELERLKSL